MQFYWSGPWTEEEKQQTIKELTPIASRWFNGIQYFKEIPSDHRMQCYKSVFAVISNPRTS